jgi:UDP-hydrolysing UDP-N-acetyl-D-glucosamine 2-epimerase
MKLIKSDPEMNLIIVATGSHLSPKHGLTFKEIEADGFEIDFKVNIIEEVIDVLSTSRAMSNVQNEITKILIDKKPNLMLVLGDRYEILSAVIAALLTNVPVAHIHGGEVTIGAFDDAIRNAITKMSHLHFASTENSKNRIIQMGETPLNVFNFGGLGVDSIQSFELLSKEQVEKHLGKKFGAKNLLVTYHPETISKKSPSDQIRILLEGYKFYNHGSKYRPWLRRDTQSNKSVC